MTSLRSSRSSSLKSEADTPSRIKLAEVITVPTTPAEKLALSDSDSEFDKEVDVDSETLCDTDAEPESLSDVESLPDIDVDVDVLCDVDVDNDSLFDWDSECESNTSSSVIVFN